MDHSLKLIMTMCLFMLYYILTDECSLGGSNRSFYKKYDKPKIIVYDRLWHVSVSEFNEVREVNEVNTINEFFLQHSIILAHVIIMKIRPSIKSYFERNNAFAVRKF